MDNESLVKPTGRQGLAHLMHSRSCSLISMIERGVGVVLWFRASIVSRAAEECT